jgi:hypothetical protein
MSSLGPPVQIAYAVSDIFKGVEKWVKDFGAGPFFISEHIPIKNIIYRGLPAELDITVAYGQLGGIMIELVQDNGKGPSIIRDLYSPQQSGLHHLAYFVDDLDLASAKLIKLGYVLAMTGQAGHNRFQFFDAISEMGHFIEIYEPIESLKFLYERVKNASINWDGSDPLRAR